MTCGRTDGQREDRRRQRPGLAEGWAAFVAFEGPRKILDAAGPTLGFMVGNQVAGPYAGITIAIGAAVLVAGYRLLRGDSVKIVLAAVAAIGVFSLFVLFTGAGRDFYLPDLLFCAAATVATAATLAGRRPLTLWLSQRAGIDTAEPTVPRVRLHRRVTAVWLAFWLVHLVVLVPLYLADRVTMLGAATLLLGKPSVLVLVVASWLWVRGATPESERAGR